MLDVGYSRKLSQPESYIGYDHLDALLNQLKIFRTYPHPSRPSQVPRGLRLGVLHYKTGEHNNFYINIVEDLAVREVQSIIDIYGDPRKVFVCGKRCKRVAAVVLVDLVKPRQASFVVLGS